MPDPGIVVTILAEDQAQIKLVRRYLYLLGFRERDVIAAPVTGGSGSGEAFVRQQFSRQVTAIRSQALRRNVALVVVTDADRRSTTERQRQLEEELAGSGKDALRPGEAVCILIPKRNVETWINCLLGETVNEDDDYSRQTHWRKSVTAASEALWNSSRPNANAPAHFVDSLVRAIGELRRFEPLLRARK